MHVVQFVMSTYNSSCEYPTSKNSLFFVFVVNHTKLAIRRARTWEEGPSSSRRGTNSSKSSRGRPSCSSASPTSRRTRGSSTRAGTNRARPASTSGTRAQLGRGSRPCSPLPSSSSSLPRGILHTLVRAYLLRWTHRLRMKPQMSSSPFNFISFSYNCMFDARGISEQKFGFQYDATIPSARLTLHSTKLCTKFKIFREKKFWY